MLCLIDFCYLHLLPLSCVNQLSPIHFGCVTINITVDKIHSARHTAVYSFMKRQ